jgi:heptosyltransferase-1
MPRLKIAEMAVLLASAKGAVAVDTGFAHLAAGMDLPIVSIYGSTNPEYTGAVGKHSIVLNTDFPCSPCLKRECTYTQPAEVKPACYATVPPEKVWQTLSRIKK